MPASRGRLARRIHRGVVLLVIRLPVVFVIRLPVVFVRGWPA